MRTALAATLVLAAAALAAAQPKDAEPRFGVKAREKAYPQNTPKAALRSAIDAIEAADFAYVVAHLMEPKFVDAAVAERAKAVAAAVEAELAQLRDFQRANPDKVDRDSRVPLDPVAFRERAAEKARERAFKQLVREVTGKLVDDPEALAALRRLAREGTFADGEGAATVTHPDVKNRTLFFKKVGERWTIENRQAEEPKKGPQ